MPKQYIITEDQLDRFIGAFVRSMALDNYLAEHGVVISSNDIVINNQTATEYAQDLKENALKIGTILEFNPEDDSADDQQD